MCGCGFVVSSQEEIRKVSFKPKLLLEVRLVRTNQRGAALFQVAGEFVLHTSSPARTLTVSGRHHIAQVTLILPSVQICHA